MLSNWHLSPALSSLLREEKRKKEIKFWLYITNFHWLIRLAGQQSTLFGPWCCKGKEAAAGWLARPQRCACYTGTTGSPPVRPSPTPPWQGPCKTTDGLGNRASSSVPPSLHKQQRLPLQKENKQQDLPTLGYPSL